MRSTLEHDLLDEHRDHNGRFTKGCAPGPGRRGARPVVQIEDGELYTSVLAMESATTTWQGIVKRLGPARALMFFEDLEAYHGPIRFRQVAIQAIDDAVANNPKADAEAELPHADDRTDADDLPDDEATDDEAHTPPTAAAHTVDDDLVDDLDDDDEDHDFDDKHDSNLDDEVDEPAHRTPPSRSRRAPTRPPTEAQLESSRAVWERLRAQYANEPQTVFPYTPPPRPDAPSDQPPPR